MTIMKSSRTLFCAAGILLASILTACGGSSDAGRDPILGLKGADLVSVSVTPATATVLVGASQQYNATANYSDGTSSNVTTASAWASASPTIATVGAGTGLARGVAAGSAALSASFGGKSGSATLIVTAPLPPPPPVLTAIAVTPATATVVVGGTQQYTATGSYSNGSTAVITNGVTWSSSSIAFGTVAPSGMATGVAPGSTTISATSGALSGNAVLNVTAPPVVVVPPVVPPAPVVPPVVPPAPVVPPVVPPAPVVPPVVPPAPVVPPVVPPVTPPATATLNLRSAASFAVLAGTSITNNSGGTTFITGDVGAPSQTTPPPQAAGFNNYTSGPILAGALADLQLAITDANSRTCTVSSASGIDLGGLVLTPGVYCYAGSINITGTFTMNGPGLYIFRTASTLNATANAVVALTGGATAENAFWIPVGPTTLGANGAFKGSILGQAAAITVGDNTTLLNGRVLSGAAVTLRNNQITK